MGLLQHTCNISAHTKTVGTIPFTEVCLNADQFWQTTALVVRRGNRATQKRPGSVLEGLVRGNEEKNDIGLMCDGSAPR